MHSATWITMPTCPSQCRFTVRLVEKTSRTVDCTDCLYYIIIIAIIDSHCGSLPRTNVVHSFLDITIRDVTLRKYSTVTTWAKHCGVHCWSQWRHHLARSTTTTGAVLSPAQFSGTTFRSEVEHHPGRPSTTSSGSASGLVETTAAATPGHPSTVEQEVTVGLLPTE